MKRRKNSENNADIIPLKKAPVKATAIASVPYLATAPLAHPTAQYGFAPPRFSGDIGFFGRYRIIKELGSGGMGAVFLALDPRLDRQVALKVMKPEMAKDDVMRERFLREGRAAAKVSHDNVIHILDTDIVNGVPLIAMPFLKGSSLEEFLRRQRPSVAQCMRIAREMALGLAAAHDLGLIHRDIKPGNVWLEAPKGRVKILDFGLAKISGADASDKNLTKSGAFMGTPLYVSLEQALGRVVDHRTDLFSLGCVLFRMLCGKAPFDRPGGYNEIMVALATEEAAPLSLLCPEAPEALVALVHQLLEKEAGKRPQTSHEVAERLRKMMLKFATENQHQTGSVIPVVQPVRPGTKPEPAVQPSDSTVDSEADIDTLGEIKTGLENEKTDSMTEGAAPRRGFFSKLFVYGLPVTMFAMIGFFASQATLKNSLLQPVANWFAMLALVPAIMTFWLRRVFDPSLGLNDYVTPVQRRFWNTKNIAMVIAVVPIAWLFGELTGQADTRPFRRIGFLFAIVCVVPLIAVRWTLPISNRPSEDRLGPVLLTGFFTLLWTGLLGAWTALGYDIALAEMKQGEFPSTTFQVGGVASVIGLIYGIFSGIWGLLLNRQRHMPQAENLPSVSG